MEISTHGYNLRTQLKKLSTKLKNFEKESPALIEAFLEDKKQLALIRKELDSLEELNNVTEIYELLHDLLTIFNAYSSSHECKIKNVPLSSLVEKIELFEGVYGNQKRNFKELGKRGKVLMESVRTEKFQRKPEDELKLITKLEGLKIDYKYAEIIPPKQDLIQTNLPENIIPHLRKGSYFSWDFYANNLFHLLKEDFFRDLRLSLHSLYNSKFEARLQNVIDKVYIYQNVKILSIDFKKNGIFLYLSFSPTKVCKRLPKIRWETSKRLIYGSLVLICSRDLKIFFFATIQERTDPYILNKVYERLGCVNLSLQIKTEFFEEFQFKNYQELMRKSQDLYVVETKNYFEPYQHFLSRIQTISTETLPFKKIIIDCKQSVIEPPSYLTEKTVYKLGLNFKQKDNALKVKVPVLGKWPELKEALMDKMQYEALRAILTKEVALIQGPPGTGKTYVGSMAVKILLDNKYLKNNADEDYNKGEGKEDSFDESEPIGSKGRKTTFSGPIIVVCQTNHALDQFLGHICKFTKNIVRVGGRCKNEELTPFLLQKVKAKTKKNLDETYLEIKNKVSDNIKILKNDFNAGLGDLIEKVKKDFFRHFFHLNSLSLQEREGYEAFKNELDRELVEEIFSLWVERDPEQLGTFKLKMKEKIKNQSFLSNKGSVMFNEIKQITKTYTDEDLRSFMKMKEDLISSLEEKGESDKRQTKNFSKEKENEIFGNDNDSDYSEELLDADTETNRRMETGRKTYQKDKDMVLLNFTSTLNDENLSCLKSRLMNDHINSWRLPFRCAELLRDYFLRIRTLEMSSGRKNEFMRKHLADCQELSRIELENDLKILKRADVVGMTFAGCARFSKHFDEIESQITIIEEASEVLEAQNLCVITPHLKHLILIGDHKQLRPKNYNFEMKTNFHFNVSLFERLIKNDIECVSLDTQRRMRPEIADFVRKIVYKNNYYDHKSVKNYENVSGINKNLFFLQHNNKEEEFDDSSMKFNSFEIDFSIGLANYLVQQNYKPTQISILTFYTAQRDKILFQVKRNKALQEMVVSTVDNYQGEENDIVILSLVRSNDDDKIGFVKDMSRICVALSRAKIGLYVIGNFDFMGRVDSKWYKAQQMALNKASYGEELELVCNNHKKVTRIKSPQDFQSKCPDGGCLIVCNKKMKCGHICKKKCHNFDHNKVNCQELVQIKLDCGHFQTKKCFEDQPRPCTSKILKKFLGCEHKEEIFCSDNDPIDVPICPRKCERKKECGHKCSGLCGQDLKSLPCEVEIKTTLPCKHIIQHKCNMKVDPNSIKCDSDCELPLLCGHFCEGDCSVCLEKTLHQGCIHLNLKTLLCSHKQKKICSQKVFCSEEKVPACPKGCSKYCGFRCKKCLKYLLTKPADDNNVKNTKQNNNRKNKRQKRNLQVLDQRLVNEIMQKYDKEKIVESLKILLNSMMNTYVESTIKGGKQLSQTFVATVRQQQIKIFGHNLKYYVEDITSPEQFVKKRQSLLNFTNYLPKAIIFCLIDMESENLKGKVSEKFDRHFKTMKSYFNEENIDKSYDYIFWDSIRLKMLAVLVYIEEILKFSKLSELEEPRVSRICQSLEEKFVLKEDDLYKYMNRCKSINPNQLNTNFSYQLFEELNSIYLTNDDYFLDSIFMKECSRFDFIDFSFDQLSYEESLEGEDDLSVQKRKIAFREKHNINNIMPSEENKFVDPNEIMPDKKVHDLQNQLNKSETSPCSKQATADRACHEEKTTASKKEEIHFHEKPDENLGEAENIQSIADDVAREKEQVSGKRRKIKWNKIDLKAVETGFYTIDLKEKIIKAHKF